MNLQKNRESGVFVDDSGMESIQAVVILAVAALVLTGMQKLWSPGAGGGIQGSVEETVVAAIHGETIDARHRRRPGATPPSSGGGTSTPPPLTSAYRDRLLAAKDYKEVVQIALAENGGNMAGAQSDVILLRRWYFDEQKSRLGKDLNQMSRSEITSLFHFPLANADHYFEGFIRATKNGLAFTTDMISVYDKKKRYDWDRGRINDTDSDGRTYSPPGNGQVPAAIAGAEQAIRDGHAPGPIEYQWNQVLTMADILLGSNR